MRDSRISGGGLNLPVLLSFNELAWMAMFLVVVLLFSSMIKARRASERLSDAQNRLAALSSQTEILTGLSNRWAEGDLAGKLAALGRSNSALLADLWKFQGMADRLEEARRALDAASRSAASYSNLYVAMLGQSNSVLAEQSIRRELLGLGGPVSNVAFIVDVSASMNDLGTVRTSDGGTIRESYWNQTRTTISNWLGLLPVHRCALIAFNQIPEIVRPATVRNSDPSDLIEIAGAAGARNRVALLEEFGKLKPSGYTDTLEALKLATTLRNVDTIIIFSDGHPNPAVPIGESIHAISNLIRSARLPPINTIGVGSYEGDKEAIAFLVGVAKQTGGTFIVR